MKACVRSATVEYLENTIGLNMLIIPIPEDSGKTLDFSLINKSMAEYGNPLATFVPASVWEKGTSIKFGPEELQILADNFNGYKTINNEKKRLDNWSPKVINLIND